MGIVSTVLLPCCVLMVCSVLCALCSIVVRVVDEVSSRKAKEASMQRCGQIGAREWGWEELIRGDALVVTLGSE